MSDFKMPTLGADMEAGTLVQWLRKPGDAVKRGDIIAVVDTDKGAIEIEAFEDGVLDQVLVQPGAKVPVGTVLATIAGSASPGVLVAAPPPPPGTPVPGAAGPAPASEPSAATAAPLSRPVPERLAPPAASPRARVSPAARRRAVDLPVDLARVTGTGPDGAVTVADVEQAAVPARTDEERQAAMRRAIAAAMSRSKREIPHAYLATSIDMTTSLAWLAAENARRTMEDRILPAALLLAAVSRALAEVPALNASWVEGRVQPADDVNLGVAISLRGGGLVVPAIKAADTKTVGAIMRELAGLVERARAGALRSSDLSPASVTVTNLGDQGVESVLGIIYPPQVALVGFGRVLIRPWVIEGRVEPRSVVVASVSVDHRAVDGHQAGLFLSALDRHLQAPEQL